MTVTLVEYSHDERSPIFECMHLMDWVPDGLFKMLESFTIFYSFLIIVFVASSSFATSNGTWNVKCWVLYMPLPGMCTV